MKKRVCARALVANHIDCREPKNSVPSRAQIGISSTIMLDRFVHPMKTAIHFNDQTSIVRGEVDNVTVERNLPAKVELT